MSFILKRSVSSSIFVPRVLLHRSKHMKLHFGSPKSVNKLKFSTSMALRAQENPIFPIVDENTTLPPSVRQAMENPEVVAAIIHLTTVAKEEGLDTTNLRPSASTMFKIATNPRIRDAFSQFREKLDKAGIVFTQEDIKQFLSTLKNQNL